MLNEDAVSGIRSPTMQIGQISDTHGTDDDGNDSTPSTHSIKVGQTISTVVGLLSVCGSTLIILAYASTSWGLWRVKQGAGTVEVSHTSTKYSRYKVTRSRLFPRDDFNAENSGHCRRIPVAALLAIGGRLVQWMGVWHISICYTNRF